MGTPKRQVSNSIDPIAEILTALSLIVGLDQLLENFTAKLKEIFGPTNVYLILYDPITDRYVGRIARGTDTSFIKDFSFTRANNLMKWLNVNRCALNVLKDTEVIRFFSPHEQALLEKAHVQLCIPLIVGNRLTGAIFFSARDPDTGYTQSDIQSLSMLSNQGALAIENGVMYELQEEKLKKLFHADKLATVGELAAGAAHEIRNPLASIRSTVQYLEKELPEAKRELVVGIIEEVDRIDQVIKGLLSFSKTSELKMEQFILEDLLNQTLLLLESETRAHNIQVKKEYKVTDSNLFGDSAQLKQVFVNILLNSIQAMPHGGEITVSVDKEEISTLERSEGRSLRIEIADTGPGIPPDEIGRLFHPFFTTKEDGTGLGLSIAYGIVNKHGGDIGIKSATKDGEHWTRVSIHLPQEL